VPCIGRTPRRPMVAEDIRDLQLRTGHCGGLRRRLHFLAVLLSFPGSLVLWSRQPVERSACRPLWLAGHTARVPATSRRHKAETFEPVTPP
jgi:hypothetical protein